MSRNKPAGNTPPPGLSRNRAWDLAVMLLLAALTAAVFGRAVWECGFTNYDDDVYVLDNAMVRQGLTGSTVRWAFTAFDASNWHPLTWLSHLLDVQCYGMQPQGHHLTSVLLHAANAVLLFWLLKTLTGSRWRSALVAALFAWHPLRVESVVWVAERKDVLSTFFGLLSLICYTRYAQGQARGPWSVVRYLASLVCLALGLMSKPMLVTLPFVMLLLDYWPLGRVRSAECGVRSVATRNSEPSRIHSALRIPHSALLWEKLPFFLLSAASCVVTFIAQSRGKAIQTFEQFSGAERLGNALVSYARYLGKIFWPADLAIFYPHPGHWPAAAVLLAVALLLALSALAVWQARRRPYFFVGWFLFVGMLIPVIGLAQVGAQAMADRYTYVPAIGIFLAVVWLVADLAARRRIPAPALAAAAVVALGLCAAQTIHQTGCWKNSETLFRHALAVTKDNIVAWTNLGTHLLGKPGGAAEAAELFRRVLQREPDNPRAWSSLGLALADLNQSAEAAAAHQTALRLNPRIAEFHINYGGLLIDTKQYEAALAQLQEALRLAPGHPKAHSELGRLCFIQRKYDDAVRHYQAALELSPPAPQTHIDLGLSFTAQGRRDEAMAQYRQALAIDPGYVEAYNNLGAALMEAGREDEAMEQFNRLLQLNPDHARGHANLAIILAAQNNFPQAITHFQDAIRLDPADPKNRFNLGRVYALQQRYDDAIREFNEALRLDPGLAAATTELASAHFELGRLLSAQGRKPEAMSHWREALRANPDHVPALNSLAWMLATDPDPALRNGAESVELARKLVRLHELPETVDTLAAGLAEAGQFGEAVAAVQRALAMATNSPDARLAAELQRRLASFQAGKPWRE